MGLGLVIFHPPHCKGDFHHVKRSLSTGPMELFYVKDGFFKVQFSFGSFLLTLLHVTFVAGVYILFTKALWQLFIIAIIYFYIAGIGMTVGSHRLWAHHSFDAKFPLRLFLMLAQASSGTFSIHTWYLNHVAHHKWSDTDADPHNIQRGLFFSHGFWLFKRRHPLNCIKAATLDTSDLMCDPLVRVNHNYFDLLFMLVGIILPTATGYLLTNNSLVECFLICYAIKHVLVLQVASLLNSYAHLFGDKPYNEKMWARDDSWLAKFTLGEGYHNYHHAFPQDYATGEFGTPLFDLTYFIDAMAAIGQAYNLKRTSPSLVQTTKFNTQVKRQLNSRQCTKSLKQVDESIVARNIISSTG